MSLLSVEKLSEATHARQLGNELQRTYRNAWNTLKMEHEAGLDSLEVIAQLTRLMDEIVTFVYERTARDLVKEGMTEDEHLVLLALGSYGRKELSPHSDIDLLFLFAKESDKDAQFISGVLNPLWDLAFTVGHSSRTTAESVS